MHKLKFSWKRKLPILEFFLTFSGFSFLFFSVQARIKCDSINASNLSNKIWHLIGLQLKINFFNAI